MTVQEVKKRLEALHYRILHNVFCNKVHNAELEALNIAIECMEELEQYRALGTVEELKEAREKQVAKKPLADSYGEIGMGFLVPICPNCRKPVEEGEHHCECGQALKWGEEDE